ncbi:phosphoribosylformimino-5-aminoimidazole carboxamide ribotide isomerase [Candidatus Blochmanniella floridana]|uniref:1-(5-phosphoribosyl)-5-[(5-phosphoribosylamino)methylideneamino] imidazole-4-carboxamide isomerase n=1 Tax=Blochmanniella floridana TaxID=203907 RepID=HIS4_BLOFL|nr:RecName: Full=1-(5-phosphoribosyl)-5-[(5-phosphoribosylamino)methylideneamino] imidazole-4-carboxamide isomerase; AltName: Full=Phosphoribosylformimino-5-aminoimidazole carboxamide ribotide isomerase [Candidatus Blochmannia floridanus]CAD83526.1 phosphoribosylformimino-5-aminoimidazole carboxamide ribotide isomerase [Candidatus Blochmannia floridanus]
MIIPALDIINGDAVRLYQGKYQSQSHYGNPYSILSTYVQQGATMIHLVDLDGARNPKNRQLSLIKELTHTAITSHLKIQIGGGIRHATDIKTLLKFGVNRVILGSIAITHPKKVKQWFTYFNPSSLVLALDIYIDSKNNRKVVIHGWQKETNIQLEEVIENYNSVGLKHVLCTDISKDGTLLGSNINLYQSICYKWPKISFQASGGVAKLTEILQLRSSGVNSIIIGRSFLEKKFTLTEAISCWQNASSRV